MDATLVEGAVANEEHVQLLQTIRERSKLLISFGDCAVTGNVTAMRNPLGGAEVVLRRSYLELADLRPQMPAEKDMLPPLLDRVWPLHEVIRVDYYLPGCPPPAERIKKVLQALLNGEEPDLDGRDIRFG